MKKISFYIDESCPHCQEAFKKMQKIERKKDKTKYAGRNLRSGRLVQSLRLRPDYNTSGNVTHWHLSTR